jgi:hypothetical protein
LPDGAGDQRLHPGVTGPDLDGWICKLRAELGVDNGADFIRDALIDLHATTRPGVDGAVPVDDQPGPGPARSAGP